MVPLKGDSDLLDPTATVALGSNDEGGWTSDVEVDRPRDSTAFSLPLAVGEIDEIGSNSAEGGNCNSSSSGRYCLARLGVDVRLFITFRPGVMDSGRRFGDGDEGPAPAEDAYGESFW